MSSDIHATTSDEIIIITAGGAGMFCGSCMQDNTLARALMKMQQKVLLLPTYTPIRVDEESYADKHVFFGGLNIYFNQFVPGWRYLPRWSKKWIDNPSVIKWATKFSVSNNAKELGELTLSMLKGKQGPHHQQIDELVNFIIPGINLAQSFSVTYSSAVSSPDYRKSIEAKFTLLSREMIYLSTSFLKSTKSKR